MTGINLNLLNLMFLAKALSASGLVDVLAQLMTGDYLGAYASFMAQTGNIQPLVKTGIEYGFSKLILGILPGTSTRFGGEKFSVQIS